MAGIFGGTIFESLGQADMTFTPAEADAVYAAGNKGGSAATVYTPPAPTVSKPSGAYTPPAYAPASPMPNYSSVGPSTYAEPASSNTTLYVVGGVAVVGLLAVFMMSGRRGTVTANRGRRGRRSRRRSR